MGLAVTGTLGILVQAKLAGHLPSVRDAMQTLKQRGIWLDEALFARVLLLAGEASGGE
jgi:predicted nucleic acid-binding protein